MKGKSVLVLVSIALAVSVIVAGCGPAAVPKPEVKAEVKSEAKTEAKAPAKTYDLKLAFPYSTTDPSHKTTVDWAKEVEQASGSRVKITIYPAGSLFKPEDTYDSVVKGVAELALGSFSYNPGRFPMYEALDYVPGYFKSAKATSLGQNAVYAKYKPKEMADVQVLYFIGNTSPRFMTKKPVRVLEDLKGVQIRSVGSRKALIEAFGAVLVTVPMSESYDVLQKGIAEGILTTMETLVSYRLNEVLKYVTDMPTTSSTRYIIINKDVWASMPADIQKAFSDVSEKYIVKASEALDQQVKVAVDQSVKEGKIQVISLPDQERERWTKTMTPMVSDYVKKLNDRGLPGKELMEDLEKWGKEYTAKYPQ